MKIDEPTPRKPLRLWPGVVAAVLLVLVSYVIPIFAPQYAGISMLWAVAGALLVILWWLLFSRARWYERVGALVLMIAAVIAERPFVPPSIARAPHPSSSYIPPLPPFSPPPPACP